MPVLGVGLHVAIVTADKYLRRAIEHRDSHPTAVINCVARGVSVLRRPRDNGWDIAHELMRIALERWNSPQAIYWLVMEIEDTKKRHPEWCGVLRREEIQYYPHFNR